MNIYLVAPMTSIHAWMKHEFPIR